MLNYPLILATLSLFKSLFDHKLHWRLASTALGKMPVRKMSQHQSPYMLSTLTWPLSLFSAVVDLNGRFFGGREVRATFYDVFKFHNFNLTD